MYHNVAGKASCLVFLLVVLVIAANAALAQVAPTDSKVQDSTGTTAQRTSLTITAAAAGDRVRITAPSSVVQMRVEVYAAGGEKLFDQEIRGGNVVDWHVQDGQAQRLAPASYVCVVTAKSISGRITQKIGTVSVEEKSVTVQPAESQQLSAAQAQTIGPVEENSSWTIPGGDELQTGTVIAHDGTDGQMIRGRGALTFRIGNFFTGIDQEQMRLTEDGRLGVGTSNPQAKLDVAGTIRAERFLVAKPTGDLKAGTGNSKQATDVADSVQPLVAGTGTQNRIAKWTDNAGTLGDSSITETGGNVGIGTTTPGSKLVVSANSSTLPTASGVARFADANGVQTAVFADAFGTNPIFNVRRANGTAASPSAVQADQLLGVIGASGFGASAYMGTRARVAFSASENWTNSANGTFITFSTTANGATTAGGTERMRINSAGNIGIGTDVPTSRLHVQSSGAGSSIFASSDTGDGVQGFSSSGSGVSGSTTAGVGVFGSNGGSNTVGRAGFFNGRVDITGNLTAHNLPGVEFDVQTDPFNVGTLFYVNASQTATIKTIKVDVPTSGYLVLFGSMFGGSEATAGLPHTAFGTLQLFDETSNTTFASAMFSDNIGESTHAIQSVLPVSAGTRTISLKVKADDSNGDRVYYYSNPNSFGAMFFPVRY